MIVELITDKHYHGAYFAKYFPDTDTFQWNDVPDYIEDIKEFEGKYRLAYIAKHRQPKNN